MIKEAMQWILDTAGVKSMTLNGQNYSTKELHLVERPLADTITVHTLSGMVDYLQSGFDGNERSLMVHIVGPTEVSVYSHLNADENREVFLKAKANLPTLRFDTFMDAEPFNVFIQSMFTDAGDKANVLKVVGNIREEGVRSVGDDGISQQVTAKAGVATVAEVKVPNPVVLAPYRTFTEVEQPQSAFVLRMKSGPSCALFEADGGAWRNQAIQNIHAYLSDKLSFEISKHYVTLLA